MQYLGTPFCVSATLSVTVRTEADLLREAWGDGAERKTTATLLYLKT